MNSSFGVRLRSRSVDTWARILALSAAAAAMGCAQSHEKAHQIDTSDGELALLMVDGKIPSEMMPPTLPPSEMLPPTLPPPSLPPRFCGFVTPPGMGVAVPTTPVAVAVAAGAPAPIPVAPPTSAAGSGGSPGSGGPGAADGGVAIGPDLTCASVPIGFWRFDDCNPSRADLGDSSFEGHTAFRNVDLTCAAGRQGLAASFTHEKDLVYVPDQPSYALDFGMTIAAWIKPDSVTGTHTLFRKSDDEDSAFALLLHNRRFEFIVRLTSGRLASVSTPATAGKWAHVAATYDSTTLRLYIDGVEVAHKEASGVAARGEGPLLIGNDGTGRRFQGRIDNVWFNTLAAPSATILGLLCLRSDPTVAVSPLVGPAVPAGTPVVYSMTVTSTDDSRCPAANFSTFVSPQQQGFIVEPSFADFVLATGETFELDVSIQSGADIEPDDYTIEFGVFSQEGGVFGFGGPIVSGPGVSIVSATGSGPVAVPEAVEEPVPPTPTGFVSVQAKYVVAEPTGCHVSSKRELMIRDVSVVDDPVRTVLNGTSDNPSAGAWSFGELLQRLSPTAADAADNIEAMFRSFLAPQTVNSFTIEARTPMDSLVLSTWPRNADGKLDLARAPVRLLAITHRLDLKDLENGKAGEGRFTYGVLDPMGFPMEFTVIFEYLLAASDEDEYRAWADAVHALQELPFPSEEYNQALQAVTDRFTGRNALPGAPNGSAIIDIRTNEIALSLDGQWQLREFRIGPESGFMAPHPLFQTPDRSFNGQPALARFINDNEAIILTEKHEAPLQFEGAAFQAGSVFNNIDFWDAPGISNPEARHKFSLNTCNGCHGAETQTGFLHVFPRPPGEQSNLSGFLTGIDVFDPTSSQQRRFSELARRRGLLESLVCEGEP
jgi:hypothetical protein